MNADFDALAGEAYRSWERATASFWDQVLDDPKFLGGMNEVVAASVSAQRRAADATRQALEAMHLPTREDIVRVARLVGHVEDRLLAVEDRLLAVQEALAETTREALKARIDAAEARLATDARWAALEARLDALLAAGGPPAAAATPRGRKR